jgi:hypothetical protein
MTDFLFSEREERNNGKLNQMLQDLHDQCKRLTGDPWCPYPSHLFMIVMAKVDDETAIRLIKQRRTMMFPQFIGGEPMQMELDELNG